MSFKKTQLIFFSERSSIIPVLCCASMASNTSIIGIFSFRLFPALFAAVQVRNLRQRICIGPVGMCSIFSNIWIMQLCMDFHALENIMLETSECLKQCKLTFGCYGRKSLYSVEVYRPLPQIRRIMMQKINFMLCFAYHS